MDISSFVDLFLHLDTHLDALISQYGVWVYAILFLVIFCETGLVVMPFLPGDSLLFLAGAASTHSGLDPWLLAGCLFVAAVLGDSCNYWIGRRYGVRLFERGDSKIFRRDYLLRTEIFYAKHGAKTVTLARFMPILRTFAPFVAGLSRMPYGQFLSYSVLGSVFWIGGLIALGYQFGNVPFIKQNLTLLVLLVIAMSLLPMLLSWWHQRRSSSTAN
ncbi:MAG: DedA family protein [Pseudomonadaceae bacterium]|nr:DedA family protein [Pseudomonadaceae bacterium]